jgi:putative FmdB family regulatory protein
MPLYDYTCSACHQPFEQLVRTGTVPQCPNCQSRAVERGLSLTSPKGHSKSIIAAGRRAAAKAGHLSNYSSADRAKAR